MTAGAAAARLSIPLSGLFPAGAVAAELRSAVRPDLLTDEERQSVSHCRPARVRDFTVGRLCARRALLELEVTGFSLLAAPDRQPLWPPSVVGSITHTDGYGAAVVARRQRLRSVGVDAERVDAIRAELWPRICAPDELDGIYALAVERRPSAAALIFVAKEAFFKCQFLVARAWFDFDEVVVRAEQWGATSGRFRISVRPSSRSRRLATAFGSSSGDGDGHEFDGRFLCHGGLMIAGMAIV